MSQTKSPPDIRFQSGVIYGWRAWKIVRGDLCSITASQSWPHFARLEATHLKNATGGNEHTEGEAPCVDNLHCGIYAYKTPSHLTTMGGVDASLAWGEVKLWGRLVEHEYAYRAQFAYPSLVVCRSELEAHLVQRNYGCDVTVDESGPAPTKQIVPITQLKTAVTNTTAPLAAIGPPGTNMMINLYVRTIYGNQYNYSGRMDAPAIGRWIEGLLPIIFAELGQQPNGMSAQVMWGINSFRV